MKDSEGGFLMRIRLLACLLVFALAGSASARPVAAHSASRAASWSRTWTSLLDFFRDLGLVERRFGAEHNLPPPSVTCWSIG
jgi:hypothetical protein